MPKAQATANETDPSGTENPDSTEAQASPQQEAANARATESGPSLVAYVGDAGTRQISKADWKAAGIEHDPVVWDASNDYTLPANKFSPEALELLKRDRNLKIR